MKRLIQKITALLTCTTLMMSISSKVYADSCDTDIANDDKYGIAICDTEKSPVKISYHPECVK